MRVTYPHMGYLTIPVSKMLESLGVEVAEAPPITKKTLELGIQHSPEGVCLPYKITLGNFLESLEQGADTFVTICGAGKCRMGFYNVVQKIKLAEKLTNNFYTINIDSLYSDIYRVLRQLAPQAGRLAIIQSITLAVKKLKALDALNTAKNYYGSRTTCPRAIIEICSLGSRQLADCQSLGQVEDAKKVIIGMMEASCNRLERTPPKVALIGEFYVLLEPHVNYGIEDFLVEQGIEVKKFVYTGDFVYANTILKALGLYKEEKAYLDRAHPYLNYHVGGDGLKSVGSALWCAKNGYDGVIHIYPFGCMPEVVAQYALKNIASDYKLPLLTLSIDEHSSDIGINTRMEAFADCIRRKTL